MRKLTMLAMVGLLGFGLSLGCAGSKASGEEAAPASEAATEDTMSTETTEAATPEATTEEAAPVADEAATEAAPE